MIAFLPGVEGRQRVIDCYIAGLTRRPIDPALRDAGFTGHLVIFAIPEYGILFRCRVDADPLSLERAAFFTALRYITTQLKDAGITGVRVLSSSPEFVFAVANGGRLFEPGSESGRLLEKYRARLEIAVAVVERRRNRALVAADSLPCVPRESKSPVSSTSRSPRPQFKPLQKGLKL